MYSKTGGKSKERLNNSDGQKVPWIKEKNMLCATWIDDLHAPQKEMTPRILFFNNETLLLE